MREHRSPLHPQFFLKYEGLKVKRPGQNYQIVIIKNDLCKVHSCEVQQQINEAQCTKPLCLIHSLNCGITSIDGGSSTGKITMSVDADTMRMLAGVCRLALKQPDTCKLSNQLCGAYS